VLVGVGDDAAVLRPSSAPLVWTVDTAVEGVHFRRAWLSLADLGWRSLMAAASDLAAMGARPRGVLSALVLPRSFTDGELEQLARGQAAAAAAVGTAVVGGNLSHGGELSITTSVLGEADSPILRRLARSGDIVAISGPLGLARAGLEALLRGVSSDDLAAGLDAWRRPVARIEAGLAGALHATAAIDISDGLALDAGRLARESGVGITFDAGALLAAGGAHLAAAGRALALDPIELALYGGEDYALLMTFPSESVPPSFAPIGRCTTERGLRLAGQGGALREVDPRGFDHFPE
jgi:thiamine-monophosphate kinase